MDYPPGIVVDKHAHLKDTTDRAVRQDSGRTIYQKNHTSNLA
jgi:hypothetical protein